MFVSVLRESEGRNPSEKQADVAQLAERVLGKDEVTSSILVIGSIRLRAREIQARYGAMPRRSR